MLVATKTGYVEAGLKVLPEHLLVRNKADLSLRLLTSAVEKMSFHIKNSVVFISVVGTTKKENLKI